MASAFVSATTPTQTNLWCPTIQDYLHENSCFVLDFLHREIPRVFVDLSTPPNPDLRRRVEVRQLGVVLKKQAATPLPPRKTRGIKRTFDGDEIYPDDDIYA